MFYDQENDEGGSYEPQHVSMAKVTGRTHNNLGHGPTCDHCNDAVLSDMSSRMGHLTNFKIGRLEHKFNEGKWR
jgi:hypothetical protein